MNQEIALLYASFGFHVLPVYWVREENKCACSKISCEHPGKHPLSKIAPRGVKDATTDPKIIRGWWNSFPLANIGIACGKLSNLFLLDIDEKHDGLGTLTNLEKEHGEFTPSDYCGRVITGGGGYHFYYRYPLKKSTVTSHTGILAGIDIRADGTYVIAPPSNHVMGKYNWEV